MNGHKIALLTLNYKQTFAKSSLHIRISVWKGFNILSLYTSQVAGLKKPC